MNFETPNKPDAPEKEKYSGADKPELPQPPEAEIKIECPERLDVVDRAIFELKTAFQTLGIENWELPEIKIKFVKSKDEVVLYNGLVNLDRCLRYRYNGRYDKFQEALLAGAESQFSHPGY